MSITLVSVGNTNHELMKFAIEKTQSCVPVDQIKVFSDRDIGIGKFHKLPKPFSLFDYSAFMIKDLNQFIDTDHVLICQYDGFAVNKEFWNEKFLQYDYVGSPTHYKYFPLHQTLSDCDLLKTVDREWYSLGGGFCLRSKKLLNAISDPRVKEYFYNTSKKVDWACEDISIGIIYRKLLEDEYDIKFGSIEDSIEFAAEVLSGYNFCLGFHGWYQVPMFLSEKETFYYIDQYIKVNGLYGTDINKLKLFVGYCYIRNYDYIIKYLKTHFKFL